MCWQVYSKQICSQSNLVHKAMGFITATDLYPSDPYKKNGYLSIKLPTFE